MNINLNTNNNEIKNDSKRVFGLDLLRALAILIVVNGHAFIFLNDTYLSSFPFIKLVDGVDLFFVLSGFLIGTILLATINQNQNFETDALLNFWKRRWYRTLPNYYLILMVNIFLVYFKIITEDFSQFNWKFFVFLQNFSSPFVGFFWESWSLAVEEWFYLLSPLLIYFLIKKISPKNAFLITAIVMLLVSLLYRIKLYNPEFTRFEIDITLRKLVLTRLDSIAFGLLAAWLYYYYRNLWNNYRKVTFILGILTLCFTSQYRATPDSVYSQIWFFTISPFGVMLLLPYLQSIKKAPSIISIPITHISKISYSMYLVNLAIVAEILRDHFMAKNEIDGVIKYGIYWLLVIIISTFLYKYFELPIMKLRDKNFKFPSFIKAKNPNSLL